LDVCVLDEDGERLEVGVALPDAGGLAQLVDRVRERYGPQPVRSAVESMNGARFVHDRLERLGWEVDVADATKVKGLAPLACKTDRIDAWVLAELSRRDLVPAIWLPAFEQRQEREHARWRLFLVRKRTALKNRVHAQLLAFGHPCPVSDLFGRRGRVLLERLDFPEPWRSNVVAAAAMIEQLDLEVAAIEKELRQLGADHRYVPLLRTVPGIGWVLGYTIAAELGDISRFATPKKLTGYTGLCPRVHQSGNTDRRGHLSHAGPRYLRWALVEAAVHACHRDPFRDRYEHTKRRLGRQRGAKAAQVDVARRISDAIGHMLTRNEPFAPASAKDTLAAQDGPFGNAPPERAPIQPFPPARGGDRESSPLLHNNPRPP
jgi:transposase